MIVVLYILLIFYHCVCNSDKSKLTDLLKMELIQNNQLVLGSMSGKLSTIDLSTAAILNEVTMCVM